MMTYTVCKVIFKGDPRDLPSSSSSSAAGEIEHDLSLIPLVNNNSGGLSTETENPRQISGFLNLEEETQFEDEMSRVFNTLPTDDWNSLFNNDEEEQGNIMFMQEDRNDYKPKKSLTGDSDSDSDSISTTCSIKSSSTCVSFGSCQSPIAQLKR
ncbi:NAC domain-containing protein 4-like isoform X2 [Raphanus sativus]|uniref:NAC domain-containing protein 4-like isoform X2 n=1 Tax=Raphanus sativus TaxID=3726 RepID=A0A9W3D5F6_RAPSA|nr:NAC domain-containing protein 4-like isoform X2 [Raphanus sativus]